MASFETALAIQDMQAQVGGKKASFKQIFNMSEKQAGFWIEKLQVGINPYDDTRGDPAIIPEDYQRLLDQGKDDWKALIPEGY